MRSLRSILAASSLIVLAAFGSTTTIPSYPIIEKRPADVAIEVWGSENQSPRGGVVLLHGCNGYGAGSIPDWAEWFVERGYVAAAVDSFSTRGIREVCRSGGKMLMRVGDAYATADHLVRNHHVNPGRIILMGFSHGGMTANLALNRDILREQTRHLKETVRFVAAISMYPYCFAASQAPDFYAPVTIIVGSKDDWTPARPCEIWHEHPNPHSARLEVNVIEGAYHAFDVFDWRGKPVGPRKSDTGYQLTPSVEATVRSRALVAAFLAKNSL